MYVLPHAMVLIVCVEDLKNAMSNVHQEHLSYVNGVSIYSDFVVRSNDITLLNIYIVVINNCY